jgi:hypothetical protein
MHCIIHDGTVHTKRIVSKIHQPKGVLHRIGGIHFVKEGTGYLDLVLQEGKTILHLGLALFQVFAKVTEMRPTLAWDRTLVQAFIVTEDNVLPNNNGLHQPFDMIWVRVHPYTEERSVRRMQG